jgi:hypothetical protein
MGNLARRHVAAAFFVIGLLFAFQGRASAAPPHWTCVAGYYGDGYCDCGCGNYDIDCDNTANPKWNNCGSSYNCTTATSNPAGDYTCGYEPAGVPNGWTCPGTWYDTNDGCDCGCGVEDPDCGDASAVLYCDDGSSGNTCSTTTNTCVTATQASVAAQVTNILVVGGMCSTHFIESNSSKLNNTVYAVRLPNTTYNEIDVWIDQKTISNVQSTYNTMKSYLDTYCTGNNNCWLYGYSAGGSVIQYALASHPNPSSLHILGQRLAASADSGSDLANWGSLASLFACPMAPSLTKTTQRALFDHNWAGNHGITTYRSGGKGHSAWAPWGWSSTALWAGSSQCSGEDDGAVGADSSGGCTSSAGRSDLQCAKYTGNTCATSGCPFPSLDHYEMKIKPMIEAGW